MRRGDPEIIGFPIGTNTSEETPSLLDILGSDFALRISNKTKGRELDGNIPEDIFIDEMVLLWGERGYGNAYNQKFIECWKGILSCFNRSLTGVGLNISSATMGAGKTSAALLALSIHTVLYPEQGAMMVCRRTKECDDAAHQINELFGEEVSLALHSKMGDKKKDEYDYWRDKIRDTKILFTTHVNFLSSGVVYKEDKITHYKQDIRRLTIVDESIGFISRYNLTKKFIADIRSRLTFCKNPFVWETDYSNHIRKLAEIYNRISGLDVSVDGEVMKQVFGDIEKKHPVKLSTIAKYVSSIPEKDWDMSMINKYYTGDDDAFINFRQSLVQDILSIESSIKLKIWASEASFGHEGPLLSSGEMMSRISEILLQTRNIQSCVVLDATAHIDNTYNLLSKTHPKYVHIEESPVGVRDYGNVTFHVRSETSGTGKTTSNDRAPVRIPKILSWAKEEFSKGDKVLFCGTKKLMIALKKEIKKNPPPFKAECMHWGCIDGRNDLKEYSNIIFLSIPNPPTNYYEQTAIALDLDETLTDREKLIKHRAGASSSYTATACAQAVGRGALRKVLTSKGDCAKCSIYFLFTGAVCFSDEFSGVYNSLEEVYKHVVVLLQEVFPKSRWESWRTFEGWNESKKGPVTSTASNKIVDYLITTLQTGESLKLQDILLQLHLSIKEKETAKNIFKPANLRKSVAGKQLVANKIEFVGKKGKGGGTLFTKN